MNYFICKKCSKRLPKTSLSEFGRDFYPFCKKCEDINIIQIPLQIMLERCKTEEEKKRTIRDIYNKYNNFYKGKDKDIKHSFVKYIISKVKETDKVLDLGCGRGWFSILLNEKTKNKVEALDVSDVCINFCKEKYNDKNINFEQGFAENLPFNNSGFDVLIMFDLLEHCVSPQKVIEEIYRVLKPQGKLFLTVPQPFGQMRANLIHDHRKTGRLFQFKRYLRYFSGLGLKGNLHLYEFTPRKIKKILRKNGFEPKILNLRDHNKLALYKRTALKFHALANYYSHTLFIEAIKI